MTRHTAWRVGFKPQPWEWTDWRWAGADGRFNGRWDPLDQGLYRTIYAGASRLGCFVELLAPYRPDEFLSHELDMIVEDEEDAREFRSIPPGTIDLEQWLANRTAASAQIHGNFVDVTSLRIVQELRPRFLARALELGFSDFDAAALKDSGHRLLTQEVSQHLWTRQEPDGRDYCDGIEFRSRHGDDLILWAIFEREADGQISRLVSNIEMEDIALDAEDLHAAISILGLKVLKH